MPEVEFPQSAFSFVATKRLGKPFDYGRGFFADSLFGDESETYTIPVSADMARTGHAVEKTFELRGIFQHKHTLKGVKLWREPHYAPYNPKTDKQKNWRQVFKDALAAWHALDTDGREFYNLLAKPLQMHGVNYFLRRYLNSHKLP
jgi:hypothetical protein